MNRLLLAAAMMTIVSQPVWAVINGDFSSGNTGFSTEFTYSPSDLHPQTTYAIVANPSSLHSAWASYGDHTTGSGLMMAVNGCDSTPKIVWSQSVPVTRNKSYQFSTWIASSYPDARAILRVTINGTTVISGFESTSPLGVWQEAIALWSSGTNTTAQIDIIDIRCVAGGNDYALDDITFISLGDYAIAGSGCQISDGSGRVRIDYQLSLPNGVFGDVSVAFSANGGATWNIVPQSGSLSGNFGSGISSGSRSIQWNATAQLAANTYNNNFRVRLVATANGASFTSISQPFTIDLRGLQGGLTVAGKVRNAITGQGLSGVSVSLAGQSTTTGLDGKYTLSNVVLANGNTITASMLGFGTDTKTISAPAGSTQCTQDFTLSPVSGTKPVVTGVKAKYDAIFIAGISLVNDYTASVDWRSKGASKVHFFWNSLSGPQSRAVDVTGTQATISIDVGREFHGTFNRCDRVITVQAENSEGTLSDPYTVCVSVIPMPVVLMGIVPRNWIENYDPKIEWTLQIPPDVPDKLIAQIPLLDKLWPDFTVETSLEYSLLSAEWEWFGGASLENTYRKRGRPPIHTKIYPKLGAGPITVNFSGGLAANGLATQARGIVIDQVGLSAAVNIKAAVAQLLILDAVPGGQVTRILDVLRPIGIDLNSIQRVNLYVLFEANSQLMINVNPLGFGSSTTELKLGPEVAYEPDLIVIKGRVYVGGRCVATLSGIPLPMIKKVVGEIYGGMELQTFGIFVVNEKFLFAHGTIWQAPGMTSRSMALSNEGPWPDWISLPVKTDSRKTISRKYLDDGPEGFALYSSSVHTKSLLAANGSRLSALEAFRLMKQGSSNQGNVGLLSTGGTNPPQLMQAELPIITNAFPYSEPALSGYGQELMLLWVSDNANSNDLQYTDIRWSRFDGTDWSTPTSIVMDTRADFAPKVAFDGNGDAVAVWQKVTDPNFTNATLSAIAAEMEIYWSRWDRTSGAWSAPTALTTNTIYDGSPLLAGPLTNGDLLVTWTRNEANLLMGTGTVGAVENDTVLCSRWSAATHEWSAPEVVVSNLAYRFSQSFAGISNRAVYAWTTDADGVLTNDSDQEVFYRFWQDDVWGSVAQLTADTNADKNVRAAVSPSIETNQNTVSSEEFETGDFSVWPWTFEGDAPWSVQGSTVYSGAFAAASGGISENQSSTMKVVVSCPSGTVSFAYNVSSEGNYDYLRFYIDGNQQDAWSGETGWGMASYPITTGQHTLQWSYTKDGSVNSGSDKAWVDSISIPHREPRGVYLVWQRDQNLVFDKDFANESRIVRPDSGSAGFADYAMTYGPQGNMVLLWQEMTTNGSDAHYSVYDPSSDTWSKDATFFNDSPLERSFSPVWDSAGQLNFAYNKVEIIMTNETVELEGGGFLTVSNVPQQGRVDVAVAVRRLITDVAILPGGFTVEGANYLPGDALTLSATLLNVGDVAVSNAAVAFYEGDPAAGGTLITNVEWSGWLEGAATNAVLSTVWVVPEPATNRTLFAVANPAHAFTEFTENNNTQLVSIGGADLSVSLISATSETDGSMRVIAQVQNLGAPGAPITTLAMRRRGESGTPLATVDVPALEPGTLAQVALDLPEGTQPEGEAFYSLRADDSESVLDIDTNNNTAAFAANLWLDNDGDGIPNWWETDYFGGPTNAVASAMASNGVNTLLQAYIAGLDPNDPHSFLIVESVAAMGTDPSTGGFRLTWGSVSNRFYRISRTTDLIDGQGFVPVAQHIQATPPVNTYLDTTATTNTGPCFYRIGVE